MAAFACASRMIRTFVVAAPVAMVLALPGCDEKTDAGIAKVKLGDQNFFLEVVADDATRYKGMGGRETVADDGGMLFVFPRPDVQAFVMRDCLIDIDIIYLDGAGRVLKTYTMKKEPARGPNERADVPLEDQAYNDRLPRYSSKYPAQFVIEIKAGKVQALGVKEGDLVKHDWEGLKRMAQ